MLSHMRNFLLLLLPEAGGENAGIGKIWQKLAEFDRSWQNLSGGDGEEERRRRRRKRKKFPISAATQKRTNQPTNRPMDGRMDKAGCRVAKHATKNVLELEAT